MKRAWRISESARPRLNRSNARSSILGPRSFTVTTPTNHCPTSASASASALTCESTSASATTPSSTSKRLQSVVKLFIKKFSDFENDPCKEMRDKVSAVRRNLLKNGRDPDEIASVLDESGYPLFRSYPKGLAFIELLQQLSSSPNVALEVLDWRRKEAEKGFPLTSEEYAKGISVAGSSKNVNLAVELFSEASCNRLTTTSTYNALMSAYMKSGQIRRCEEVFRDLKLDGICSPTIVTYNILLSLFGRSMLVEHMEEALKEMEASNLSPDLMTYNNLIDGYVTSWMWESMERVFQIMKAGPVKPNIKTYSLMLRGYAHSGKLEKMEEMYELVKYHECEELVPLIRHMIVAYCKSSVDDKIKKIQALMQRLTEDEYRPWLNVCLIYVCAKEDLLEEMEKYINEAFEHKTSVNTLKVMKLISGTYYRWNAVDRLASFVKRAETAEWRICRTLYHCKMILYSSENRLKEMEGVLSEMENFKLDRTKKTFTILYNAYSSRGETYKVRQVLGLMCTHGYRIPLKSDPS